MTDTTVTRLPVPGVILDLDSAQRPEKDVKPPFIVTVGEKQVTFTDPGEIDWQILAGVEIPADLIHVALSKDDRKHIFEQKMPAWKFNLLMEGYYDHYDLEDRIREAKRRQALGA